MWLGQNPEHAPHELPHRQAVDLLFVFVFSSYLYWYGKRHGQARHLSGKFIHDFWMGTGHNPRVPPGPEGLDLKIFCEARPGLILWVLINTSFAYVQYEKYGFVSTSMINSSKSVR